MKIGGIAIAAGLVGALVFSQSQRPATMPDLGGAVVDLDLRHALQRHLDAVRRRHQQLADGLRLAEVIPVVVGSAP